MVDSSEHLDAVRRQFTRQADAYARMRQTTDERSLGALVLISDVRPEHRVLDVACGPGFLTMSFAARCAEAVGIDATETWRERARAEATRRGLVNVTFQSGDAERLEVPNRSFDVVACRAAFHHFPRPDRVLAEMTRVVRAGGRLLIADMLASEDPAQAAYHDSIERLCDPTHARCLPESEFRALFSAAGLEVVAAPKSPLHYDVDEWIAHGGPSPETARDIVAAFEASLDVDRSGLAVRREDGRLRFSHTGAAFVLGAPAA
jgi:ubiquinone/menaquinone biosynthesis C-methylase UbiE